MVFPNMSFVDIGSNLTHECFNADRAAVLDRAVAAGVTRQVVTGADLHGSRAAAALAAAHPGRLWSTAGVHPHHASAFDAPLRVELLSLLRQPSVVAVGECGLDYFRNFSSPAEQRTAFVAQLEMAASVHKPVFLHQREAHEDFKAIVREYRAHLSGGVAHCFTGGVLELDDYLRLDLSIGVTGWICDERRGNALREAVPHIPPGRLMIETDAPYLLPRDLRPKPRSRRNEPAHLPHVAAVVATLLGRSLEEIAETTTRNAVCFFGLDAA